MALQIHTLLLQAAQDSLENLEIHIILRRTINSKLHSFKSTSCGTYCSHLLDDPWLKFSSASSNCGNPDLAVRNLIPKEQRRLTYGFVFDCHYPSFCQIVLFQNTLRICLMEIIWPYSWQYHIVWHSRNNHIPSFQHFFHLHGPEICWG